MKVVIDDGTIRFYFTSNAAAGNPVAPSAAFVAADFAIYKDGSADQKTTTNGLTVTSPFDSIVGLHLLEIDCSNDTGDAGFWAVGSTYEVRLSTATTVDSLSVSGYGIGEFRIQSKADLDDLNDLSSTNVSESVWDSSVATYSTIAGSFGKAFKNLSDGVISVDGSVNDASATASSFVTNLSSAVPDFYNDKILVFTSGLLEGQARIIHDYDGGSKTVSFDESFTSAPADGDDFVLLAIHQHTLTQINGEVLDVINVDTLVAGQTVAESLRRIGAITSGEVSNAGTSQETFKDYAASGSTIVVTVDASGNRTGITYN